MLLLRDWNSDNSMPRISLMTSACYTQGWHQPMTLYHTASTVAPPSHDRLPMNFLKTVPCVSTTHSVFTERIFSMQASAYTCGIKPTFLQTTTGLKSFSITRSRSPRLGSSPAGEKAVHAALPLHQCRTTLSRPSGLYLTVANTPLTLAFLSTPISKVHITTPCQYMSILVSLVLDVALLVTVSTVSR